MDGPGRLRPLDGFLYHQLNRKEEILMFDPNDRTLLEQFIQSHA